MPQNDDNQQEKKGYTLPPKKEKVISPLHNEEQKASTVSDDDTVALNLIRQKLNTIYDTEPDAKKELQEDSTISGKRSKHQEYMHSLSTSGKSLAEIQTAWHTYYVQLPDKEKHAVWQEFYDNYNQTRAVRPSTTLKKPQNTQIASTNKAHPEQKTLTRKKDRRSTDEIKQHIRSRVRARHKNERAREHHMSSLKFGLITGFIFMSVMLFGFFNERFIAPFIAPSTQLSATPLIMDENGEVGLEPKLIIPKINVEVPVVYDEESIEENAVQKALERGVLHYATTPDPGELGNSVIFGHSSNNILNKGDYKFAFVLLSRLEDGDTFFIEKDGVRYTYRVYEKKIVAPEEVSVLGNAGKKASMTLITCDPPGTAVNRLVVIGEQIDPSPDNNTKSSATNQSTSQPEVLPSDAPSLWERFTRWLTG